MRAWVYRVAPLLVAACAAAPEGIGSEHPGRTSASLVLQQLLTASDVKDGAHMGVAVDIDGDTAIVGDDTLAGSAHVFVRSGASWSLQDTLTPASGWPGFSVALRGDTAVLGGNGGRAFVYNRTGTTWTAGDILYPSLTGPQGASPLGGITVSLDANTVILGHKRMDPDLTETYEVFVFDRANGAWTVTTRLILPPSKAPDFELTVVVRGDTILLGVPHEAASKSGYVAAFQRTAGTWNPTPTIFQNSDKTDGDNFGASVALSDDGTVALIGTYGTNRAASYVFTLDAGAWTQTAQIPVRGSVAVRGDDAVICDATCTHYTFSGGALTETETLSAAASFGVSTGLSDFSRGDRQGVAVENGTVIVGAPLYPDAGAAYVFSTSVADAGVAADAAAAPAEDSGADADVDTSTPDAAPPSEDGASDNAAAPASARAVTSCAAVPGQSPIGAATFLLGLALVLAARRRRNTDALKPR